jgi:phenylacetate-CoA ligase
MLLPLLARRRGDLSGRHVRAYEARLALDAEGQAACAREDLRALLVHAAGTTAHYARVFAEAGLDPRRVRGLEDLAALPVVTRATVAQDMDAMVSRIYDRAALQQVRTGGTTGAPRLLLQDREAGARKDALTTVLRRRMGWRPGMRAAFLWGAAQDLPARNRPLLRRWKEDFVVRWVQGVLNLPADTIHPDTFRGYARRLRAFRPDVLQGYPAATDHLARMLLEGGERVRVPLVVLTAEPVTAGQRERIAEAFGARVLTFYGSRENGWIASECPQEGRLHVNTAGVLLETAEDGRLLVTDLLNRGMPLIRYDVGDRGRLAEAPCACGDPRPVLGALEGRASDLFVLPSGRVLPGLIVDLRGLQADRDGVLEAQLVQEDLHHLTARYVAAPGCTAAGLGRFERYLDHHFGGELAVRLERVERIEPEANGKVRHCLSRVPLP